MFFDLRSRRDEEKNGLIRSLRIGPEEAVRIFSRFGEEFIQERREFGARFAGPPGDRLFTCLAAGGKGSVDAFGFFQHCLLLRHPETVCDLKGRSLREALTVFLPIVLNRNDKQTAFAGSLYSALVLSGWTLLSLKAAERALSPDIMIVESRCSYRHAIISDCLVDCVLEQDPFREYAGRSFFTGLECVARVEDLCCVEFYGKFYVKTVSAA